MKRLCFVSPDLGHAHHVVNELKGDGIEERHIYVVAREGMDLEGLPDAGPENDDFLPAYERGIAVGGTGGLLAGLFALSVPGAPVIGGGTALLFGLYGAGLGGLLTGIAGASFSSTRLRKFREEIESGKLLVMADVPADRVDHFEELIRSVDSEVEVAGIEPEAPIIP